MKLSDISELSKNDVLSALGLSTKQSTSERLLGSLGLLGLGALVGAGVALLLAPRSGQELREDLGSRMRGCKPETSPETGRGNNERSGRDSEARQAT